MRDIRRGGAGRKSVSAFADTRATFASPRWMSKICLKAIPHSRTRTTDLGKLKQKPLLDHGRLGRDGPQHCRVLGGVEAANRLNVADEDVAVVRLGYAIAERLERLDRLANLYRLAGGGCYAAVYQNVESVNTSPCILNKFGGETLPHERQTGVCPNLIRRGDFHEGSTLVQGRGYLR